MVENVASRLPVSRSRDGGVLKIPTQGDAQRFVQLGFLLRRERQPSKAFNQPRGSALLPRSRFQPSSPRRVGLDIRVVFKQGNETRAGVAQLSSGFVVFPGDLDLARHTLD